MVDHRQRASALAARVSEIRERKEDVLQRLRAGAITDVDAARELAALLVANTAPS
jgi:hypothetical protein